VGEEYPWVDESGNTQFLDIIVQHDEAIFTIECKKTQKEKYTFLIPNPYTLDVTDTRCLYLEQINDSTQRLEIFYGSWEHLPRSASSSYCIISTSDTGKDTRLLERDAQLLIKGTDYYALKHRSHIKPIPNREPRHTIIPVLVTNAKLYTSLYNPVEISMDTGQIDMDRIEFTAVKWIRFVKAFTNNQRKELHQRTIFIVSSSSIKDFLMAFRPNTENPKTRIIV